MVLLLASRNEARSIYFGERAWFTRLGRPRRSSTMLVALEYLDFTKIVRCFSATSCHSMLITRKNSDLQWSQPFLYIHARNADVHHNLNVSNPVPKVYTIYDYDNVN